MKNKNNLLVLVFVVLCFYKSIAQPGKIDTGFNPLDSGFWKGNSLNNRITDALILSDGKYIVTGYFTNYNGEQVNIIARINPDGTLDKTFNTGTATSPVIRKIALQKDGKILIAGNFQSFNGLSRNGIARLNADGTNDLSFDPGTGFNNLNYQPIVTGLLVQADNKIIIAGDFTSYNGVTNNRIVRIHENGSLDSTFKTGTGTNYPLDAIAQQADGKTLVGSTRNVSYNGVNINGFARLNTNGSLDTTFKKAGNYAVKTISVQTDGKILAGGFQSLKIPALVRLHSNGIIDSAFSIDTSKIKLVNAIHIQSDGRILIARGGKAMSVVNDVTRLKVDGSTDPTFNPGIGIKYSQYDASIESILSQPDGKIIIGGVFSTYDGNLRNHIVRVHQDGTLDNTVFTVSGQGVNGTVWCSAIQDDGKILLGGLFTSVNGVKRNNVARLNIDGTVDTTFNPGSGADDWVECIAIQKDGKILLAGWFSYFNGTERNGFVRLNANGAMDNSITNVLESGAYIENVAVQKDGKILLAGNIIKDSKSVQVVRLNSNGSFDNSFTVYEGGASLFTLRLQADDKIVVSGFISSLNNVPMKSILRLNTDGTIDKTFQTAVGVDHVIWSHAIQNDGKIIIVGAFTTFNLKPCNRVARLNTDGTLDTTFNAGSGASAQVFTVLVQPGGKVIIGGVFDTYNGVASKNIACLNTNGSIDNTFDVGTGANGAVYSSAIQNDGKLIIGGFFSAYNGTGRNRVMRLNGSDKVGIEESTTDQAIRIYPNPNDGLFNVSLTTPGEIYITDVTGKLICNRKCNVGEETIDLSKESNGVYFITIKNATAQRFGKVMISK